MNIYAWFLLTVFAVINVKVFYEWLTEGSNYLDGGDWCLWLISLIVIPCCLAAIF